MENQVNKKICFIDIEANQIKRANYNINYILEYSIVKENGELTKVECKHEYTLKRKIKYLINKSNNYYKNKTISEKEAYLRLLKISNDYDIYTFGNYDQTILDDAANRYKLQKITLIDYSNEIVRRLKIPNQEQPSLKALKFALNIEIDNCVEHESSSDAKVLYEIYKKINTINESEVSVIKNRLKIESFRPKLNAQDTKAIYVERKIKDDFNFVIIEHQLIHEKKEKLYVNKDIDEYKEIVVKKQCDVFKFYKYDQEANLIDEQCIEFEHFGPDSKKENIKKFTKAINLNYDNAVMFCNRSWKDYFIENNENKIFNVVYCLPLNLFQKYKESSIKRLFEIIVSFYENNHFNNVVDYSKLSNIISKLE